MKYFNILLIAFFIFSCRANYQIQKELELINKTEKDKAKYSLEQQLIMASFNLDFEMVNFLLKQQINLDARIGEHDNTLFMDKWDLGWPISSSNWTALIAVSSSNKFPPPITKTVNTTEGREIAQKNLKLIKPKQIKERDNLRLKITKALAKANANLNLDDGYGGTALSKAVDNNYEDMAIFLIQSGANVNTKTGVYIDGTGDISPIHTSVKNPKILREIILNGGNVSARDDSGDTPLHWATLHVNIESVKILIKAGANVNAKNKEGQTPLRWEKDFPYPSGASKEFIRKSKNVLKIILPNYKQIKKVQAVLIKAGAETQQKNNEGAARDDLHP